MALTSLTSSSGSTPLREQVQRHGHDVDIAGALAIAEQGAFDPVGAGHQREFRRRDRRAAIVVRVDGKDHARAVGDMPPEPLERVGVGVWRRHLDRRRQVENQPPRGRRLDDVLDRLADVERKIELGAGKTLRRIFEMKIRARVASASAFTCFAALTAMSVNALADRS